MTSIQPCPNCGWQTQPLDAWLDWLAATSPVGSDQRIKLNAAAYELRRLQAKLSALEAVPPVAKPKAWTARTQSPQLAGMTSLSLINEIQRRLTGR